MRVLLVSPNVESLPDPVFPIGLSYIAGALNDSQIEYQVLDLCFVQDYERAIQSALDSFQPDVAGLSLRNIDNVSYPNYVSYLSFYRQVVEAIRRRGQILVIVGGSGFSLMPEEILEYLGADFGIAGEGELSFVRLINQLKEENDLHQTSRPRVIQSHREIIADLDDLPIPDRSGFDNEMYLQRGGMGNIQTKRGCPFKCIYCSYPIIEGKEVRLRTPRLICDEIERLLEHGIDNIFIVDSTFNHPVEHAQSVCKEITSRKLEISWSCYANPRFVTKELIDLMLSAGCTGVEFGSDAANETMLANLCKGFTVDDLRRASTICQQSGISFCHSLLLGGPGETMETVHQTLNTVVDMSPTAVICMIGIGVFPGTRLYHIALEEGITDPEENFLKPVFYLSPAIEKEILPFIKEFSSKQRTWIFPGLNINMSVALQKKLRRFGIKGPLWEYMKMGERFKKK